MSIFSSILHKIFNTAPSTVEAAVQSAAPAPSEPAAPSPPATPLSASGQPVDVEAVLTKMASEKGGGGNWEMSIVDLLKMLDLDSSLDARKELGGELGVHAGADGSAEQNIALHKAVMQKLAENGGKVPESLKG